MDNTDLETRNCSPRLVLVNVWKYVYVHVCVYISTHHTPEGTAEEVEDFIRDGGRAC